MRLGNSPFVTEHRVTAVPEEFISPDSVMGDQYCLVTLAGPSSWIRQGRMFAVYFGGEFLLDFRASMSVMAWQITQDYQQSLTRGRRALRRCGRGLCRCRKEGCCVGDAQPRLVAC